MNASAELSAALDRVGQAGKYAGLDRDADLEAIRRFAEGPVVITVAAGSGDLTSGVSALLTSSDLDAVVQQAPLNQVAHPALRDFLIVVTPADRALSQAEENVIRAARLEGGDVALTVTDAGVLGDGQQREQAIREIEQLRLGPALMPLAVPWFFLGAGESDKALTSALRRLPSAPVTGHESAAWRVLLRVVRSMHDDLAPRLAAYAEEEAQLRRAEAELAGVRGRLEQETRLVEMSVRESLRAAEQSVYRAGLEVPGLVLAWLTGGGQADWAAVEAPLRRSWQQCLDLASHIVDLSHARFASEVERLDPLTAAGAAAAAMRAPSSWDTDELKDALAALSAADMEQIFTGLRAQVEPDDPDGSPSTLSRIGGYVQGEQSSTLPDGFREHLNAALNLTVSGRMAAVIDAASAAAAAGARAYMAAAMTAFTGRLAARRAEFDEQTRWTAAHKELTAILRGRGAQNSSGFRPGGSDGS